MTTPDNEILINHQKRMTLRRGLNKALEHALDDKMEKDDILAEMHFLLDRYMAFAIDAVIAYRYGLKEREDK